MFRGFREFRGLREISRIEAKLLRKDKESRSSHLCVSVFVGDSLFFGDSRANFSAAKVSPY